MILDDFSQLLVSYSGGKDSTACLLWALSTGKPVRAIMSDTGNELPDTFDYVDYIESKLGISIEVYKRVDLDHDFFSMVRARGRWPMYMKCNVSKANKLNDFRWYIKQTDTPMDALIILGQRRAESIASAGLHSHPAYGRGRRRVGCVWCVNQTKEDNVLDSNLYPQRCEKLRKLRTEIGLNSIPKGIKQIGLFDDVPACLYEAVHCE